MSGGWTEAGLHMAVKALGTGVSEYTLNQPGVSVTMTTTLQAGGGSRRERGRERERRTERERDGERHMGGSAEECALFDVSRALDSLTL